jgi:hypothetical protein
MLKFSYTRYPGNISPIPIVNFHFRSLEFPLLITSTDIGILDTGCDVTLISYTVASKLQLEFSGRQKPILTKSSNQIVMGVPFRVDVSFDFDNYFTTKVYALPDDFMRDEVIIGRNILNRYVVNLDGRNGVFTIS